MSFDAMANFGAPSSIASGDGRGFGRLRAAIRPLRRVAAWFALVDEERSLRNAAADQADLAAQARLVATIGPVEARLREEFDRRLIELEDRTVRRLDAIVSEVVHGSEVRDARLATEVTLLAEQLVDQEHERTAILRALAGSSPSTESSMLLAPATAMATATVTATATSPPSWYSVFEAIERGSRDDVFEGFRLYASLFEDATAPVVDIGCGRGEFVELAKELGIPAYGVDSSADAVAACTARGLRAVRADLFEHLRDAAPSSIGGAFCAQVVEHLPAEAILEFFELLAPALTDDAAVVVETPNPASFAVHVQSFWRDPTHIRPVPPQLLFFAARRVGLVVDSTIYSAPPPDEHRLAGVDVDPDSVELRLVVKRFNETIETLNDLLFGPQNYAAVLRKPHV